MLKEKIAEKLEDHFSGSDLFLVDVKASPQDRITVFIDGAKDVTIDKCVAISRMLEEYLESEKLVRESYTLEVSSPGLDQPFKVDMQYRKAIGRPLEVLKKDGIKHEGVLKEFDGDTIRLEIVKKKKNRVVDRKTVEIPLAAIKSTKQLITF